MVDQGTPVRRSTRLLMPVIGGLVLIAAVVAGIAFRLQLWHSTQRLSRTIATFFTDWAPAHPRQTGAIVGFAVVALALNWVAHVRGRLRAWIFAVVVEVGLWTLFWYGPGIPSLNDLVGLHLPRMTRGDVVLSGVLVIAITGAVFWFLEAREEWRSYRRLHHVQQD